ncbi:histidine phosphatase superfamily [Hysterangium stoloniferum]|nr:histidine phosphatase superfamily [Hysterangium stoloniferum]
MESVSNPNTREVPLDVENYPVAPAELELEQVHIYIRHGERTPVGLRLTSPAARIPEHWLMCTTGRKMRAAAFTDNDEDPRSVLLNVQREVERKDGSTVESECMLGELTDLGRQTSYNYGQALRKLYIDRLHFLPTNLTNDKATYFRSTNMPRTIESLQHLMLGLYPSSTSPGFTPRLLIRNGKDENLLGNKLACNRLELMARTFAQAAADTFNPLLEKLDEKVGKYVGGPLRIDGKPRASGVLDTLRAAQAHGLQVPPEFEEKEVSELIVGPFPVFQSHKTHEFRRLAMGRLLDDLQRKITHKAEQGGRDPLKILVHSTHDTALAGLCTTLDVFDERWPAFTAAITFELFRGPTTTSANSSFPLFSSFAFPQLPYLPFFTRTRRPRAQYYVRMRYQNRTLALPLCADAGNHLPGRAEFCTLDAFRERLKELSLTSDEFERDCAPR